MRIISVLGSPSYDLTMFILELAWVLSREKSVYCYLEPEVYYRYALEGEKATTLGELTLISEYEDLIDGEDKDEILITDALFGNSDTIVYALTQSPFSSLFFEDFVDMDLSGSKVLVFLNFIDSPFDEDYFKKYQLNKKILDNISYEEVIDFDEEVRRRQIENTLNRVISLKNYPKAYKHKLYNIASHLTGDTKLGYKEFYKELDKRISIC